MAKDPSIELLTPKIIRRFNGYVFKTEDCWIWRAAKDTNGYGRFGIDYKVYLSHRIAYLIHHKEIDSDLNCCHSCDNPPCCNPDHLFQGTRLQNMQDCVSKERQNFGIKHSKANLSEEDVLYIRHQRRIGRGYTDIANEFGMKRQSITDICNYKNWKHVP